MRTRILAVIAAVAVVTLPPSAFAAEGRINVLPKATAVTTISAPGTYVLVSSVIMTNSVNCIDITASDVTLDLNGQTLKGTGGGGGLGINVTGSRVRIVNGFVTNFGGGGIILAGGTADHFVSKVFVNETGPVGIDVAADTSTVADSEIHKATLANIRVTGVKNRILRNNALTTLGTTGISILISSAVFEAMNFIEGNTLGFNNGGEAFRCVGNFGVATLLGNRHGDRSNGWIGGPPCNGLQAGLQIGPSGGGPQTCYGLFAYASVTVPNANACYPELR